MADINNSDNSGDKTLKPDDTVKVPHVSSAQSGIEQLLTQGQEGSQHDLGPAATHESPIQLEHEGVAPAHINPIYMQPNTEGSFEFTKKEFLTSISDDKIIQHNIVEDLGAATGTTIGAESEFAKANFGQNLHGPLPQRKISTDP